jgi:hypothetical protein
MRCTEWAYGFLDSKELSFQNYGMPVVLQLKCYLHKSPVKMKQNMDFNAFFLMLSTIEELLGRKSSGSDLEIENTAVGIPHADHVAPSINKKSALTSLTSGDRSVGIGRSRTQATEFSLSFF